MKSIYTYYKERLIEISGKNRSLYAKKISKKASIATDFPKAVSENLRISWKESVPIKRQTPHASTKTTDA